MFKGIIIDGEWCEETIKKKVFNSLSPDFPNKITLTLDWIMSISPPYLKKIMIV